MKAINKFFYALLALATVGMVGCQNAETYEPGAPELDNCYDVFFPDAETLEAKGLTQGPTGEIELDPTEKTEFTYTVFRNNFDDEITVPVAISNNTEGKFAISEIKFEAGEDVAEFKVSLLESEVGVTYDLTFSIEDPQYVKQYESNNSNSISLSVTRVKWDYVGDVSFTDGFLSWWLEVNPLTYNARLEVRADSINKQAFEAALAGTGSDAGLAGMYRLVDPYNYGPFAGNVSIGGYALTHNPGTHYLTIDATNPNEVVIPLSDVGLVINGTGSTSIVCSYAGYLIYAGQESKITEDMYGKIVNGVLTFGVKKLLVSPSDGDAGSLYYANQAGEFALNIAPELNCYELVAPKGDDDGDFVFENVKLPKDALFYSESQTLVSEVVLEKGKPAVDTDDADRAFVQQYGYLYRLPNLYAEDYPIYFTAALDGTLTSHPNFVEQETGLKQNGYDVYMAIDAASSTFDPETGLMNLVAEFYSYQGKYIISYGVYNEAVSVEAPEFPFAPAVDLKSDFTYSALFTDTFTSAFQASEWEATLEKGTSVAAGAEAFAAAYGTAYRIPNAYASGYDIYFAGDAEGKLVLPAGYELQATGVSIYGQQAYLQITGGTVASNGVSFSAKVCNADGELIMPAVCTESLETYVWVDAATGSWYCNVLKDPLTGLTLQNAEGTNLYRVVNFFTDVTGVEDKHFVFSWNKTTNRCEVQGMQDTGLPASALGVSAPGNIHFADEKTTWNFLDYPDTWESLEAEYGVSVQPYFDPAQNAFFFRVSYFLPEAGGMLTFTGSDGNETYFVDEVFVLDGQISEGPQWLDVATGNYATILSDNTGAQYVAQGVVMQQKEGTDKYRLYDWCDNDVDVYLNFQWDKSTNKIDILGLNDSGLPGSIFGEATNAYICDVKTYYNEIEGIPVTWDDITAAYKTDLQSYYTESNNTISFIVCYVFPENTSAPLLADQFWKETYTITSSATTSEASYKLVSSEPIAIKNLSGVAKYRKVNVTNQLFNTSAVKVAAFPTKVKKSNDSNKQTPVKRSIRENVQLNEKL